MDVFTMVVLIVSLGIGYSCFEVYMKSKTKQAQAQATDGALLAEMDAMRARIEVLEKILTDDKHSLKQQIEALERN